ncbi:MAG: transcriptional regulator [Pseudomonadota bacterium]|nr:transcriptional regulator [Pseudomonadota bacterium]
MDLKKFSKIAESLKQYRRAELKDFEKEIGSAPVEELYVDPLPNDAILESVLSTNTTFLLGRKGTGKSTIFARAQAHYRKQSDVISIYLDVKSLYDKLDAGDIPPADLTDYDIDENAYRTHILRKTTLGKVIAELLNEINKSYEQLNFVSKKIRAERYKKLKEDLSALEKKVQTSHLEQHEIPVLQKITKKLTAQELQENTKSSAVSAEAKANAFGISGKISGSISDFDRTLDDKDTYVEYSDVVLKSFPFNDIIKNIQSLLEEAGLKRVVVFFDDFSELPFLDQKLFVDVILSPLNNSSNEAVKLKIAGYPGRIYYGKIDPSKTDTITLDFSDIYDSSEVQEMERLATSYTERLLTTRFKAFKAKISDYFEVTSSTKMEDYMEMLFQASFNVPRIMGYLLHQLYLDRVSNEQKINTSAIKLASRKYYQKAMEHYFEKLNRFALEPYQNKLDRHNQNLLLKLLINEAKDVRKKNIAGRVGGTYFNDVRSNPPASHFTVTPQLEEIFSSLESNFFLSRYRKGKNKQGIEVTIYALAHGICEMERIPWGYPEGRDFRGYFTQRCFEYTRALHNFLSKKQTIRCKDCLQCFPLDQKDSIKYYKWRCPECSDGICEIVDLADDFSDEIKQLDEDIMLEPVEYEIINTLHSEDKEMRAGEISALIDTTYQMVGKRTDKLQDMGLVNKDKSSGSTKNKLTDRAEDVYF